MSLAIFETIPVLLSPEDAVKFPTFAIAPPAERDYLTRDERLPRTANENGS